MTTKKLVKKFADHCDECEYCFRCRFFSTPGGFDGCLNAYLEQISSGKMTPEDDFEDEGVEA